jgi:hypothetical protein
VRIVLKSVPLTGESNASVNDLPRIVTDRGRPIRDHFSHSKVEDASNHRLLNVVYHVQGYWSDMFHPAFSVYL